MGEIEKLRKMRETRISRQTTLKEEIAELSKKIRELEKLYEAVYNEELQHRIAKTWLKDGKMTDKQILKLLEVGNLIHDKIDILDADTVVKAVTDVYEKAGGNSPFRVVLPEQAEETEKIEELNLS